MHGLVDVPQAYGEAVCSVLNFLAQKALAASGHVWRRPVYAQEETAEVGSMPNNTEFTRAGVKKTRISSN